MLKQLVGSKGYFFGTFFLKASNAPDTAFAVFSRTISGTGRTYGLDFLIREVIQFMDQFVYLTFGAKIVLVVLQLFDLMFTVF